MERFDQMHITLNLSAFTTLLFVNNSGDSWEFVCLWQLINKIQLMHL